MKKFAVLLLFVSMVMAGSASAADQITLKLTTLMPAQSPPVTMALKPWVDMVEKASEGTLKIDLFPGGVLGSNMLMHFQQMDSGVFDMALIYPSYFGERFPESELFYLPFIANTYMEGAVAAQTLFDQGSFSGFEKYKMLMFVATSPFYLATSYKASKPEDLKGHTMRSGSKIQADIITQLGMTPVGMPVNEQAEALARGLIDGTISDPINLMSFRLSDKARNMIMVPVGNFLLSLPMNKAKYDSLPPKAKAALDKYSGMWLSKYWATQLAPLNDKIIEGWKKDSSRNIVEPNEAEMAQWKTLLQPVTDNWIKGNPSREKLWKSFQEEAMKVRTTKQSFIEAPNCNQKTMRKGASSNSLKRNGPVGDP